MTIITTYVFWYTVHSKCSETDNKNNIIIPCYSTANNLFLADTDVPDLKNIKTIMIKFKRNKSGVNECKMISTRGPTDQNSINITLVPYTLSIKVKKGEEEYTKSHILNGLYSQWNQLILNFYDSKVIIYVNQIKMEGDIDIGIDLSKMIFNNIIVGDTKCNTFDFKDYVTLPDIVTPENEILYRKI